MIIFLIVTTGIMAGIYAAFSFVVMRSLATLSPLNAAKAMNAINTEIVKTLFMPIFFGSTVLYCVALISEFLTGFTNNSVWLVLAAAFYLVGMFLVTLLGNVPMNKKLQAKAADEQQLTQYWPIYLTQWTKLNHLRTFSCILACTALCYVR